MRDDRFIAANIRRGRESQNGMTTGAPNLQGPSAEDRERLLIEAVVSLARSLRDERDRLAERLKEVEQELSLLAAKLQESRPELSSIEPAKEF